MSPTILISSWSWHLRNGTHLVFYFLILRYDRRLDSYGELSVHLKLLDVDLVAGVSRQVSFFSNPSDDCSFSYGEISLLNNALPSELCTAISLLKL